MRQSISPITPHQKGFDWCKKWKRFQMRTRFLRPFSSRRGVTGHRGTWGTPQSRAKMSMCDILKKTNNAKEIQLLGAYWCLLCSNCVRRANFSLNYSTLQKTLLLWSHQNVQLRFPTYNCNIDAFESPEEIYYNEIGKWNRMVGRRLTKTGRSSSLSTIPEHNSIAWYSMTKRIEVW